jgi:hypothetical protein
VSVQGPAVRELAPGGDSDIVLEVRGAETGIVRTNVTIATNDPERPTVTVPIYGYVASPEQVERLARGVVIVPQRAATREAELLAVRVTNNQETAVSVSGPGQQGRPLILASGQSGTLEVRVEGGGREGSVPIQVLLPSNTDTVQPSERK